MQRLHPLDVHFKKDMHRQILLVFMRTLCSLSEPLRSAAQIARRHARRFGVEKTTEDTVPGANKYAFWLILPTHDSLFGRHVPALTSVDCAASDTPHLRSTLVCDRPAVASTQALPS